MVDANTIVDTDSEKSFEVVFATETPVFRYGWDENFNEILVCAPENIRKQRLDALAVPLLDNHDRYSGVTGQMGRVDSYTIENGECRAKIIFSTQERFAGIWQDIKAGIVRSISAGYKVYKYVREIAGGEQIPNYRATDWEPMEISLAPVPADFNSAIRSEGQADQMHEVIIENFSNAQNTRSDMVKNGNGSEQNTTTTTEQQEGSRSAQATTTVTAPVNEAQVRSEAAQAERKRISDIRFAVRAAKLEDSFADELVDKGVSIDQAREQIFNKMAEKDTTNVRTATVNVAVTGDEGVNIRAAMQDVILSRCEPGSVKLEGKAQDFRGMKLLDMARHMLQLNGDNPFRYSQNELVSRAISTTDYPDLLTSTVNRQLRRFFEAVNNPYMKLCNQTTVSDFRAKTGVQIDGKVTFDKIAEDGEYKAAKILQNSKATVAVETYGKLVKITRKAIINDDLDAFSRIPKILAQGARNLQTQMFWDLIIKNAKTPDGVSLFHATHGNLAGAGATISEATLNAAMVAMMKQQSPAGEEIGLTPKYLIVPVELQTTAQKLLATITATKTGDVNPFHNAFEIISEVRLSRDSATAWYMAADPSTVDGLICAYLDGEEGLYTESRTNFDDDSVETKARMEFGVAAWEHRGWYKNPGA